MEWGYNDVSDRNDNSFNFKNKLHRDSGVAFEALGIDPRSVGQGGPNQCFGIEHQNGPTIPRRLDGRLPPNTEQYYTAPDKLRYRVSEGIQAPPFYYLVQNVTGYWCSCNHGRQSRTWCLIFQ